MDNGQKRITWDNYVSLTAMLAVNNTSVNIG